MPREAKSPGEGVPEATPATSKAPVNPERLKALDTALAQIERQFGKGSVKNHPERPR
jgi:hypothetical protein